MPDLPRPREVEAMLAAVVYMVFFRIIHIVAGVIWVGSLSVVVVYVQPIASGIGPAAAPFMAELRRRRLVDVILVDAVITIAAGAFLYWHDWHLFPSFGDWIGTRFGAALTVGALLAIAVIPIAALVTRPTIVRLATLGRRATEEGGASPQMAAQIAAAQRRLAVAERTTLVLAVLAVVMMASARYL